MIPPLKLIQKHRQLWPVIFSPFSQLAGSIDETTESYCFAIPGSVLINNINTYFFSENTNQKSLCKEKEKFLMVNVEMIDKKPAKCDFLLSMPGKRGAEIFFWEVDAIWAASRQSDVVQWHSSGCANFLSAISNPD